jgi:hypothetical protein
MLETFKKWLEFRGLKFENFNHEAHEKLKFKFEDESLQKEWRGFYSVYSNGFNEGIAYIKVKLTAFTNDLK